MPLIFTQPYILYGPPAYSLSGFTTVSGYAAYVKHLGDAFYIHSHGSRDVYRSVDASQGFVKMNATTPTGNGYHLCRNKTSGRLFMFTTSDPNQRGGYFSYSDNNGATWTNANIASWMKFVFGDMAASNSGVVIGTCYYADGGAVGATNRSTDNGATYHDITSATGVTGMQSIKYVDHLDMFIGALGGRIYYSTNNGTTWTGKTITDKYITGLIYTGTEVLAIAGTYGGGTTTIGRSSDGINWTFYPYTMNANDSVRSIAYFNGEYYVTHNTTQFYVSPDLTNWSTATTTTNTFTAAASATQLIISHNSQYYLKQA